MALPTEPAEQETIPVPALISPDLFQAAAERLEENRRRYRTQKKGTEYLLSGLLVCARCGSAYCGRRQRASSGTSYVYYHCLGTDRARHAGNRICTNAGMSGQVEEAIWSDLSLCCKSPVACGVNSKRACSDQPRTIPRRHASSNC